MKSKHGQLHQLIQLVVVPLTLLGAGLFRFESHSGSDNGPTIRYSELNILCRATVTYAEMATTATDFITRALLLVRVEQPSQSRKAHS